MGYLKTEEDLEVGDFVMAIQPIIERGFLFNTEKVSKGMHGVVLARYSHWLSADEISVKFENGEHYRLTCGDNVVIGTGINP